MIRDRSTVLLPASTGGWARTCSLNSSGSKGGRGPGTPPYPHFWGPRLYSEAQITHIFGRIRAGPPPPWPNPGSVAVKGGFFPKGGAKSKNLDFFVANQGVLASSLKLAILWIFIFVEKVGPEPHGYGPASLYNVII